MEKSPLVNFREGFGRSLGVEAHDGWKILNSTDELPPTPAAIALARSAWRMEMAAATFLGPPTGRYNCHGLVFASRRTNIPPAGLPDSVRITELLWHDGFEKILGSPRVGDVVIYRESGGDVDHSGIVSRLENLGGGPEAEPIVFVWSMWGSLGEFEHNAGVTPYRHCSLEFWRLNDGGSTASR